VKRALTNSVRRAEMAPARAPLDVAAVDVSTESGSWAYLPKELMAKVLELLQAAEQKAPQRWCKASATLRLVCSGWKAVHDALVMRLLVRKQATDQAVGMLVRRFPAVTSVNLVCCSNVTDEGLRAVSSLPALTSLDLANCTKVTDEGLRAVRSLAALTFLDLAGCDKVTAAGVQALRSTTAAPSLHIEWSEEEDSGDSDNGEE
jgi:hypothetical protein